jgi:5'-nucleotidase
VNGRSRDGDHSFTGCARLVHHIDPHRPGGGSDTGTELGLRDRRSLVALAAVAGAIGAAPLLGFGALDSSDGMLRVQLLAVNDFHGHLEPHTPGTIATEGGPVRAGGVEFLATHIEERRARNPNTVVVSAGDLIGASRSSPPFFHDEPTIEAWNRAGLDFSCRQPRVRRGYRELVRLQRGGCHPVDGCGDGGGFPGAGFTFLAANVHGPDGATIFPPYGVRTFAGAQVAFVGMTLEGTPGFLPRTAAGDLRFEDEAETVNRLVPVLRGQGIEAIVVLLHEGGKQAGGYGDCEGISGPIVDIVERTDREVDVFVTGHTHRAYDCEIDGRLVTSAGSYGRVLTDIDLAIDPATGDVASADAENVVVTQDVARHPRLSPLVSRYRRLAAPVRNRVVGMVETGAGRGRGESGGSALGRLVADAQVAATGADAAFTHADGIRADLARGRVTYGEAFEIQPFEHRLVSMTLTGAEIDTLLEQQWLGQPFPRLLESSSGLRYTWDPAAPPGRRVEALSLRGRPLERRRSYRITVNSFLADGGNNFPALLAGRDRAVGPTDVDALARFFTASSPLRLQRPARSNQHSKHG